MSQSAANSHTVEKIGGTSISATDAVLRNVFGVGRESQSLYRRIFVISAYAGVTDLMLEAKKTGEPGVYALFASAESEWAWGEALSKAEERMRTINREIFDSHADRATADAFILERIEGARSCLLDLHRLCSYGHFRLSEHLSSVREMLSAIGEAHSAHNTSLLLRQHGVNTVFIDLTGWRRKEEPTLVETITTGLQGVDLDRELPILTGYAYCREGMVKSFDRGYTEVTFSRVAAITQAREAIIHKEFHLSTADPKILGVEKVRKIGRTNYDVADQLSNMGMEAIHPRAAKQLRQADIPLRVKNTFSPDDEGTVISCKHMREKPGAEIIAGRRGVLALEFYEQDMVGVKGYDATILSVLDRHRVGIVSKSSNANTITHYLHGSLKAVKRVIADLETAFPTALVTVRKVAVVSVIGSDLKASGLTALAATALADAGVEVLGLHQPMRNVDIQFIIDENDYDASVIALHERLIAASASLKTRSQMAAA